jgi:hypothetical protein
MYQSGYYRSVLYGRSAWSISACMGVQVDEIHLAIDETGAYRSQAPYKGTSESCGAELWYHDLDRCETPSLVATYLLRYHCSSQVPPIRNPHSFSEQYMSWTIRSNSRSPCSTLVLTVLDPVHVYFDLPQASAST